MQKIHHIALLVATCMALSLIAPPVTAIDLSLNAGAVFRDCDTCPDMVVVPAGRFMMGL